MASRARRSWRRRRMISETRGHAITAPLLDARGLEIGYGGALVVKGVDLCVGAGQIVCLIGANGAGKTTILRGLSGLLKMRAGSVRFDGEDVTNRAGPCHRPPAHRARSRGAPDFRGDERRRKPCRRRLSDARARRNRSPAGRRAGAVSAAEGAPRAARRAPLGRRTADAGDRPRPDGRTQSCSSSTSPRWGSRRSSSRRSSPSSGR